MRPFLLILAILACGFCSRAQLTSAEYYKLKRQYPPYTYRPKMADPYRPGLCGLASFVIPGLGQVIAGAPLRGLGFFAADVASTVVFLAGSVQYSLHTGSAAADPYDVSAGGPLIMIGLISSAVTTVWSTVDAIQLAKVRNLASRDGKPTGLSLQLAPDLRLIGPARAPGVGLTCRIGL